MKQNIAIVLLVVAVGVMAAVVLQQRAALSAKEQDLDLLRSRTYPVAAPPAVSVAPMADVRVEPAATKPATQVASVDGIDEALDYDDDVTPVAESAPPKKNGKGDEKAATFLDVLSDMVQSEGMKDIMAAQQEVQVNMIYGELVDYFAERGVDTAAFKQALLARQLAVTDESMALLKNLGGRDKGAQAEAAKRIVAIQDEHDARLAELLGEEEYAVFEEFEQTQPERQQVKQFSRMLPADQRLTGDQEHDLIRALHDGRNSYGEQHEDPYDMTSRMQSNPMDPEQMRASMDHLQALDAAYRDRAATVLTEPQMQYYDRHRQQQQAMQQAGMKMAEALMGKGTQGDENTGVSVQVQTVVP